ncbi:hypothetical protein [Paludibaculum fermentans]|uniref:LTXXQ motif family protein n=1 Tax=Paludibaculum fermentans TaxID=1473598 RepID=A0A7S7SKM1_PALFE|nr:hypothetical protein [Paludibaculum fermentans]QOY88479.1 hypothetical protein IRI77_00505 [Paludibaculum fermentans]
MSSKLAATMMMSLLALCAGALPAQQEPTAQQEKRERAQERLQQIKDRLKLTPEQSEQVRPIVTEEFQRLKEIRDKHSGDSNRRGKMKMAREMRDVQSDADSKLSKVLSKTQMDELKKMRAEWRQQMRDRAGKQ